MRQVLSVLLIVLILGVVAFTVVSCSETPEPETNVAGDATEIEAVFDEQFPEDESTTFSDDFDTLENDLALS